ncbi:cupredoxin domain-containing protein [Pseudarthrobacter cellobiosi]|uniref:cupredoxin domain-containing protein n=1 Tax=Pseudarthrobacter cellobiosi TaxID=2953654 RepID=UPI00208F3530|nr:cupredoxin domain-containing protein [Pseudarthrobacter sp. HLT1-5]MCO4255070.1 cupredoxin domain-containing protein [Pseudarthrobacter sp. HLT1-5]
MKTTRIWFVAAVVSLATITGCAAPSGDSSAPPAASSAAPSAEGIITIRDFKYEVPGGATVIFQAPDAAGEYGIICSFHPQMTGTLVVK